MVKTGGPKWNMAMVQNQSYHFGIGAPPILVYSSGDWDVYWGYGVLTHGHMEQPPTIGDDIPAQPALGKPCAAREPQAEAREKNSGAPFFEGTSSRSPSSALLPLFAGGFPY